MAIFGSGTSTVAAPLSAGSYTLSQLVDRWRKRLDDIADPYQWSNDVLTEHADTLQKMILNEMTHVTDRTTPEVCEVALVADDGLITLSPRIIGVIEAKLDSGTSPLQIRSSAHMDLNYNGWFRAAATGAPSNIIIVDGVGYGKAFIYPKLAAVSDTLRLTVVRGPLVDLDWAAHSGAPLEIDRFAHLLAHGVMWLAYTSNDGDGGDPKKAESHRILWEGVNGKGGDKEKIRRMILRENSSPKSASPMMAFQ